MNEGATRFEPQQIIEAHDEDKTSHVVYAIVAGNDDELFKIDSETGRLRIAGSKGLDVSNETDNIITLTILVSSRKEASGHHWFLIWTLGNRQRIYRNDYG